MKQPEIILHVGMHKTGTTSIQKTLDTYLNDPRFVYVKLSNPNHSKEIFTLFEKKNHPKQTPIQQIEKYNKKTLNRLIENFQEHTSKTYIISGESIRTMSPNALMNLKVFLEQYFYKITVVAYIRSPKSYMESALQQIIKGGADQFDLDRVYPNYRKFKQFFNIFGEKNVKLWKFDPKKFPNNNVVLDFCQRLNIELDPKGIINDNESMSKEALSLLYIYRKFGPEYGKTTKASIENHSLIEMLSHIKGHKIQFGPSLIKPILDKNRKDIEWMESILGESLTEDIVRSKHNIVEEKDLLTVPNESIKKLKALIQVDTTEKIANLIQLLRINA